MKKLKRAILLLSACALLSSCTAREPSPLTPIVTTDAPLPSLQQSAARSEVTQSTLWFRFADEPCLAPESRVIEVSPTMKYETALMNALMTGPASSSGDMSGLFPAGTQVLDTYITGRILFVTLSREIMNPLGDEPSVIKNDPDWAREIPLRRALAMQSIAATATENCPVDTVVVLVEQGDAITNSLRLRQGYYRTGEDPDALAEPLHRDESMLLTPMRTAEIVLQCCQERDFTRLYRYVARKNRPELAEFTAQMAKLPHLTQFALTGGSVDGLRAIFTLKGKILKNGAEADLDGRILRLNREDGAWRIPMDEIDALTAETEAY